MSEVRDLFTLGPCVEPLDRDDIADFLDRATRRYCYRFFRGCEGAPFDADSDNFELINAWYLSEAALLAYADARVEPDTEQASGEAARFVTEQISAPARRLFEVLWAKRGYPANPKLTVHAIVRVSPVIGVPDPVQCYVVDDGSVGIVAFRGTVPSSLPNWLTDCEIALVSPDDSAEGVLVHEGFWNAATALMQDFGSLPGLESYLRARVLRAPGLKLWFTGHSFGGALATLAGYRLRCAASIYSYGSPRVGNSHFARAFSELGLPHYRIVHRHDIVPYVPPPIPLLRYEHVGDLKYVEWTTEEDRANAAYAAAPSVIPLATLAERGVPGIWQHFCESASHFKLGRVGAWLDHVLDHSLLYYSNTLWNEFVQANATRGASDHTL